jgi:hypothetical protein
MTNKNTYSNRQIKSDEELFAPDDPDAELVGGKTQVDPYGYLDVKYDIKKAGFAGLEAEKGDGTVDDKEEDEDNEDEEDKEEEKLGSVTSVTFEQVGKFTGDGTYLADVTITINDVKGAQDYEIEFQKIS